MKNTSRITSFFGIPSKSRDVVDFVPTEAEVAAWTPQISSETEHFVMFRFPENWMITRQAALLICERLLSLGYRVVSGEMGICEKIKA